MTETIGLNKGLVRLSAPTVLRQARRRLTDEELAILRRVAGALIPAGDDGETAGDQIADFGDLAHEALAIMDPVFDDIIAALGEVAPFQGGELFDALRSMDSSSPKRFHRLSLLVTSIYLYSPEIEAVLDYPHPHRNRASMDEVVEEIESGLLEPVIARGSIYREA